MRNGSSHDYIARYRTSDGAYEHVSVVGIIQHLQISNIWVKFHVEKVCLPSAGRAVQFLSFQFISEFPLRLSLLEVNSEAQQFL